MATEPARESPGAALALLARIEEAAADGRLPAMLNLGPLEHDHPLYSVWRAMQDVREAYWQDRRA